MNKGAKIKTDMSSALRGPSDLHWQSEITWVINGSNDDEDDNDVNDKGFSYNNRQNDDINGDQWKRQGTNVGINNMWDHFQPLWLAIRMKSFTLCKKNVKTSNFQLSTSTLGLFILLPDLRFCDIGALTFLFHFLFLPSLSSQRWFIGWCLEGQHSA